MATGLSEESYSAHSIREGLSNDLIVVFIDDVTYTIGFDHVHGYAMVLKDGSNLVDSGDMFMCRISKP
jgi:hypothetical protein